MQAPSQNKTLRHKNIKSKFHHVPPSRYNRPFIKYSKFTIMKRAILTSLLITISTIQIAEAKPNFAGVNYSGTYLCKGNNSNVGDYQVITTLTLNRAASRGSIGIYDLAVETENAFTYKGKAVANANKIAFNLSMSEVSVAEFSTGIANISKNGATKFTYTNHYYEVDSNVGTYGKETCEMQKSKTPSKKTAKAI